MTPQEPSASVASTARGAERSPRAERLGARALRVVHVEDNPFDAELVHEHLRADGLDCDVTRVDDRAGLEHALRERPVDLVLSDFSLPSFDGPSALETAQRLCPDVPFVFVSGAIGEERAIETLRSGATDYVLKNRLERLAPAVRRALRERNDRIERQRARDHAERLQSLSSSLVAVLSASEVARVAVAQGLAAVSAQAGACWLVDATREKPRLEMAGYAGDGPHLRRAFRYVSLDSQMPVSQALAQQRPVWLDALGSLRPTGDREVLTALELLGDDAPVACLPLVVEGRTLGALALVFAPGRVLDGDERALLIAVAELCAQALDRARLYRESEEARVQADIAARRAGFLAEASEALASSLEYETTLVKVARLAVPLVADIAGVYVLDASGAILQLAVAHEDPQREADVWEIHRLRPVRVDDATMVPTAIRTREPVLLREVDDAVLRGWSSNARVAELLAGLALRSSMAVPFLVRGRVFGALVLSTARSGRRFGDDDLQLARELARRVAATIENVQLFREAQRASRLKDEFLATVSHELRTPMNAVLGWATIVRARSGEPEMVRRGLEIIERNARAQARLIEDVLDVSRIINGKLRLELRAVDLLTVVRAGLDAVTSMAQAKGVTLTTQLDPAAGSLVADPDRIQQVVWNLGSNAVKFTPRGGRVTVSVLRERSSVRLRFEDTGQGIEPEFLPHIFERFRQADSSTTRKHGGLGLGLAIARHLVELHGGEIRAESEGVGRGTAFTVSLPVRAVQPVPEPGRSQPVLVEGAVRAVGVSLAGLRVLVLDDEADARGLVAEVLGAAGAEVLLASDAREALELVERARLDVLVSDIGMAGTDGYAFIRALRARDEASGGATPAIALTAYARGEDARRALSAGFQRHMTKPVDPDALVLAVATLAGRAEAPAEG